MYVIRDGPVHQHAMSLSRGKLPRPIFFCCGSIGVVFTISGGVLLGIGQNRFKTGLEDYTFILIGSIILGFGLIMTVLAVFLGLSWASLSTAEYEASERRRSRASSKQAQEILADLDNLEMNGCRRESRVSRT